MNTPSPADLENPRCRQTPPRVRIVLESPWATHPRIAALISTFDRPVSSGLNPAPSSSSPPTRPLVWILPSVRLQDTEHQLQQRRLARSIGTDDAECFASFDFEGNVAQRPELAIELSTTKGQRLLESIDYVPRKRGSICQHFPRPRQVRWASGAILTGGRGLNQ